MNRTLTKISIIATSVFCWSCLQNNLDIVVEDSGMVELSISAQVASSQTITKALSSSDELQIDNIYVLVFDSSTQVFAYMNKASNIVSGDSQVSFDVSLSESDSQSDRFFLVLLANISDQDIAEADLEEGRTSLNLAMENLCFSPATNWQSGDRIPMWCQLPNNVAINRETSGSDFGSTQFIRSLARINITNLDTENFTLESATLYNSVDKALIAPASENFSDGLAIAPTVPQSCNLIDPYTIEASNNCISNEFYVGEKRNSTDNEPLFLIIEGSYKDDCSSYYRIDLCSDASNIDILRNNTYQINITSITSSGASTMDQAASQTAINSGSSSSDASLTVWNDSDLNYIFCDGSTTLAVNTLYFELYANGGTSTFEVQTDNSSGYTATIDSSCDWMNNINTSGSTIYIVPKYNNTGSPRQTTMTISSGGISCEITLYQDSI